MKLLNTKLSGKVVAVLSTPSKDDFLTQRQDEVEFDFEGIPGDRHFGFTKPAGGREKHYRKGTMIRNNRQWSAVSVEELKLIEQKLEIPSLQPEWIGANLVVEGIEDFSLLPRLTHLRIMRDGKEVACLVSSDQNKPCRFPDRLIEQYSDIKPAMGFAKAGLNLRGLVGWVDAAGVVKPGDTVQIELVE